MRGVPVRPAFLLLFAVMLAIAAGNTALQSVLPAIGRSLRLPDTLIAIAFSFSALIWSAAAGFWARRSDRHGRRGLVVIGMSGFVASLLLCGLALTAGLRGWLAPVPAFACFVIGRLVYGAFGAAAPPAAQAIVAMRTTRAERTEALTMLASAFGLGTILGPALAPFFVLPGAGLAGPAFVFAAGGVVVLAVVWRLLPDDMPHSRAVGAATSEASISGLPLGASVLAADQKQEELHDTPVGYRDPRIAPWLVVGLVAGHAQAMIGQTMAFLVIDRLALPPVAAQPLIGIVLMAGAGAALLAQWGLIPKLDLAPRGLVLWGALVAAAGAAMLGFAGGLHGIAVAFALTSLGFGLLRPGFTAGASLAVGLHEQSAVAGRVTSVNGVVFVLGPSIGVGLYELWRPLPYWLASAALLLLAMRYRPRR